MKLLPAQRDLLMTVLGVQPKPKVDEAAEERRAQGASIVKRAGEVAKTIDADAIEAESKSVAAAVGALAKLLAEPVSADALAKGEAALLKLGAAITAIGVRCEADRKRRQDARTILVDKIAAWSSVAKAATAENEALATLAKSVTDLVATPSDKQLEDAGTAATSLEKKATALALLVEERQLRFDKAATLAERVKAGTPSLTLHDRAPADAVLQAGIATQRDLAATYADWAKVTEWDETALTAFEQAILALEKTVSETNTLTEQRIEKVTKAEELATTAITAASSRAFSPAQQVELMKAVMNQADAFKADITKADPVAEALGKLAQGAAGLSSALAGLARRLGAVPPLDDGKLSIKEKAALKQAKDAATKALDEVTQA